MKQLLTATLFFCLLLSTPLVVTAQQASSAEQQGLSLITATPDEGFALAIALARRAVSTTQPNRDVLVDGRAKYSVDPDSLIAVSQVVAIHFQTISKANDYWKE